MNMEAPIQRFSVLPKYPSNGAYSAATFASLKSYAGKPTLIHLFTSWGGCWPCSQQLEKWAGSAKYRDRVNFLAIGCAGPQMAVMMRDRMKMSKATVGFIARDADMPRWGQLGCNGFILLDGSKEQKVLSKATPALNSLGEQAFRRTEALLDSAVAGGGPLTVMPGQQVQLIGLATRPDLNGQVGVCIGISEGGRLTIELQSSGQAIAVKEQNLLVLEDPGGPEDQATGNSWQPGGVCEPASSPSCVSTTTSTCASSDPDLEPLEAVASVGHDGMDEEHEKCIEALNALVERRDQRALLAVEVVLREHFEHEERLLDEHLYNDADESGGFAAVAKKNMRKTHYADHARILGLLAEEAKRTSAGGAVGSHFIAKLLEDFDVHADKYDGAYAEDLQAAVAAAF